MKCNTHYHRHHRSYFWPVLLIVLGGLFLSHNLGYAPQLSELIGTYWPLILIALGISALFERHQHRACRAIEIHNEEQRHE